MENETQNLDNETENFIKGLKTLLANPTNLGEFAKDLAAKMPTLKDLNQEQLEQVAKIVIAQRLSNELDKKVEYALIDLEKETEIFLKHFKSQNTKRAYRNGLAKLFNYCKEGNIELLGLTPMEADNFLYSLSSKNSPSTARIAADSASSFFTFLERRHKNFRNPFRGTKARPKERKVRNFAIPTKEELEIICQEVPRPYCGAIYLMALTGLRIGALPTLKRVGNRYTATSKGKDISLEIDKEISKEIEGQLEQWQGKKETALQRMINYFIEKIHKEGKIQNRYSSHDFRHFFAVNLYEKTRDIYKVKQALHHTNTAITERYLRGIGQI